MGFKSINKSSIVRKTEKRSRRLQRKVSRKYDMNEEGNRFVKTSNIVKVEKSIRLLYRRLANIRTNHIHPFDLCSRPTGFPVSVLAKLRRRKTESISAKTQSTLLNGALGFVASDFRLETVYQTRVAPAKADTLKQEANKDL
jgi:hypothetical protein